MGCVLRGPRKTEGFVGCVLWGKTVVSLTNTGGRYIIVKKILVVKIWEGHLIISV